MPRYLTPGVYIEEAGRGPKPIDGVPTGTAAIVGETERGSLKPTLVTSFAEYRRNFGQVFGNDKYTPYAVNGFFENGGKRLFVCRVVRQAAVKASAAFGAFNVEAIGPGTWGNRLFARIEPSKTTRPTFGGTGVEPVGFRLLLAYYRSPPAQDPLEWFNDSTKPPKPTYSEIFEDLVLDEASPDHYEKRLKDASSLAMLVPSDTAPGTQPSYGYHALENGSDGPGPPDATDYGGEQGARRRQVQGLAALRLDPCREVSLVYAPGVSFDIAKSVVAHCAQLTFRFAVVDCEKTVEVSHFDPRSAISDTGYAALYYPWVWISEPQSGGRRLVPPGGHVLGIYARTDSERGVFKAPANEVARGVLGLQVDTDDAAQHLLNQKGINTIRQLPDRGIRVWGARTLSSDDLWKYVSVRRFIIFLEHSIYEGTQWVVFEPNDDQLWTRVTDAIRLFLRSQWRLGALMGRTDQEAFFVRCDRTTMTQDDILNGRLICEIGVALVRPAEFVVFRIFQNTAQARL